MSGLVLPAIGVALLTAMICLFALPIGQRFRLLDYPGQRKAHAEPTPLVGGIVVVGVILPSIILWWAFSDQHNYYPAFVVVTGLLALIGMIDDIKPQSALLRLFAASVVFAGLMWFEPIFVIRVLMFEYPFINLGLIDEPVAALLTLLAFVGLVNAVNMADGKNGLVIGLCIGWLALLLTRAPTNYHAAIFLIIVSLSVLLIFNLRGSLFLGDGGAYGLASAVGLLAILVYNTPGPHGGRAASADEIALLLFVPVLDFFRLFYRRIRRGVSPFEGDRDHLHHHLQNRLGWPRGLYAYWLIALGPATIVFLFG